MVKKVDKDVGKKIKRVSRVSFKVYNKKQIGKKLGNKALKFVNKNKLEVGELPSFLTKKGFIGYRQTGTSVKGKTKTTIFLDKKLKGKERDITFWHEAGHHKAKRMLKPNIRKKLSKEAKGTKIYNLFKKQGYTSKQIPEEILVEKFAKNQTGKKVTISKKFPTFRKQLKNLIKRN